MLGISSSAFLTGKYSHTSLCDSCDKKYLYPSSLKKHFMVSHWEQYEAYIVEKNSKFHHHVFSIHLSNLYVCDERARNWNPLIFSSNLLFKLKLVASTSRKESWSWMTREVAVSARIILRSLMKRTSWKRARTSSHRADTSPRRPTSSGLS